MSRSAKLLMVTAYIELTLSVEDDNYVTTRHNAQAGFHIMIFSICVASVVWEGAGSWFILDGERNENRVNSRLSVTRQRSGLRLCYEGLHTDNHPQQLRLNTYRYRLAWSHFHLAMRRTLSLHLRWRPTLQRAPQPGNADFAYHDTSIS